MNRDRFGKIILSLSECYDAIKAAHQGTGHGGLQATTKLINEIYYNLTQEMVKLFTETCENCQLKRNKTKKGIVVKPIASNHLNSRCQIDLIDLQTRPDGDYKFIEGTKIKEGQRSG
ncbi:hypothetical protein NQ314_001056 [Rhamnusium bicolor]|uniref:Integrase zinc-binding domain-containing protein n=1 Tax=Rhamnusium bicolor TaxID=1586634 RepID=A0AAV8ZTR2_9CUCU|nr:hypothetical protein NQ314_001056 [Rhamnusium bicolor]